MLDKTGRQGLVMDDEKAPFVNSAGIKCFLAFWSLTQTGLVFHAHLIVRTSEAVAATPGSTALYTRDISNSTSDLYRPSSLDERQDLCSSGEKAGDGRRLKKKAQVSPEQNYLPRVTNSCVAGLALKLFSLWLLCLHWLGILWKMVSAKICSCGTDTRMLVTLLEELWSEGQI